MKDFVDAFTFMGDRTSLLVDKTVEHLHLSGVSIVIALLLAIPLGLWLGHRHRGSVVAINVANIGRALPSLALISIGIGILGIGFTNVVVALVVLAVPPMLTNAYVAVDEVESDSVEAARGMGMRPSQVFWKVEFPLSLPLLFAGIRTAAVYRGGQRHPGRDRGRGRARRHHRQPGELRCFRRSRSRHVGGAPRPAGRSDLRAAPAPGNATWTGQEAARDRERPARCRPPCPRPERPPDGRARAALTCLS
ncbi:MAG: ABC transporter permease subunit [Actinobacteria bacterium]|nr:ABC transporter permease subunit [Actinomycetota bacterium]